MKLNIFAEEIMETGWIVNEGDLVDKDLIPGDLDLFVIGDVHGRNRALDMALDMIKNIRKDPLKTRALVFTGDLIDRGPGGLECLTLAADAGRRVMADKVDYLLGNHELMFMDALCNHENARNWLFNGGIAVADEAALRLGEEPCKTAKNIVNQVWRAMRKEEKNLLKKMIPHTRHGRILLVHAGADPYMIEECLDLGPENHLTHTDHHWAWIRDAFLGWEQGWNGDLVVHGHTPAFDPVPMYHKDCDLIKRKMDRFQDRGRICVDAGAAAREVVGVLNIRRDKRRLMVVQPG